MVGEIDGGFSWEGKNKVVNLFLHPVFGQGWQAHRKLEMVFQDGISVSESLTRGHIPSSIICSDSPFLSFHPSSSSPSQKSAGESDWEWPGESCNIVFHCSSFVCSLKCAQIEQGTNVIEWNAIIANK